MTAATEARSDDDWESPYLWAGVVLLGADVGLAYANHQSLAHDEPGLGKGIAGLTIGSLTAVMGATAFTHSDEAWEFGMSLAFLGAGVVSAVFGGKAIKASIEGESAAGPSYGTGLVQWLAADKLRHVRLGLEVHLSF